MSLSVSNNQTSGIDSRVLREVTQQIFRRAEAKSGAVSPNPALINLNKKADLGMDLYNGRVDASLARQVAMNNAGLQVQLNSSLVSTVNFLNTEAAKNAHKPAAFTANEKSEVKNNVQFAKFNTVIGSANTDNEKNGSNPFYKGELLKSENNDSEDEGLNLVA